ncbi:HypC/HybG/HupF family hydrogenase formation chaperone [Nocardia barduliensis]|uniref:HypC/HybG/HupF family hydrogenase formation chaperone n=1 Tax=Nocardia barduliensis TaxID=2736643 RepID=UPI0015741613|nr:HypC/HybG/HupF family hydrogenase formation chaperone [Nocardia barduliensis]
MCLGIPGRVMEIPDGYHEQIALVEVSGRPRRVNIGLLDDDPVRPGDWVIIHMGFAVEKTDEAGAAAALDGLRLLQRGDLP